MPSRLVALMLMVVVLFGACSPVGTSQPTTTAAGRVLEAVSSSAPPRFATRVGAAVVPSTTTSTPDGRSGFGGVRLWRVDPSTLAPLDGSAIGPVGWWVETVANTESEVALVGYDSDSSYWVFWLLDLETDELTQLAEGGPNVAAPFGIVIGDDHIDWVRHLESPGTDPNVPDGLVVRRFDRATKDVTTLFELGTSGLYADQVMVMGEGDQLGVFGRDVTDDIPRVLVFDLNTGRATLDVNLDTVPPVIDVVDRADYGWVGPAWDRTHNLLYVPHLYSEFVTTVDLDTGAVTTNEVAEKTSFLDRVLTAWLPPAHAKGASSHMTAAVAPDGSLLYLTGTTLEWVEGSNPSAYRELPVGIVAVEPQTMSEVARTDLPLDRFAISPTGEVILAAGWWEDFTDRSYEFGSSGLHLLDAKTLEPLSSPQPLGEAPYYDLAFSADGRYAYATERDHAPYTETPPRTLIIDTATLGLYRADPRPVSRRVANPRLDLRLLRVRADPAG